MAARASMRSRRVSPMPIRMPVVNGTASSPASRSVSSRAAGCLSGEPKCGPPRAQSRSAVLSSIMPCDALTRRRLTMSAARHDPRIHVRQQFRLAPHELAHGGQILERGGVAARRKLLARRAVAQLRLVAEREERLVAPCFAPGASDGEHLVRTQVCRLAGTRRLRERAVAADVAAQARQRNEDLPRVRHDAAVARIAQRAPLPASVPPRLPLSNGPWSARPFACGLQRLPG